MRAVAILVALAGCGNILGFQDPIVLDGTAGGCYGTAGWQVCLGTAPTQPLTLPSQLDTDTSTLCAASALFAGQPSACVIGATSIDVPVTTTAVGSRPLVLVASGAITVEGMLDVSSHRTGMAGAGANAMCSAFAAMPGRDGNGGGGGAGASFATAGGDGGSGNGGSANGGAFNMIVSAPSQLRGGCRGQDGGLGSNDTMGVGGAGGGAVYFAAGMMITITGAIDASGAGGTGAPTQAGGGGGGSGGMIVMSAPMIEASGARLVANGGGGASGATSSDGTPGADPDATMPVAPALGGTPPTGAGHGGSGFAGSLEAIFGDPGANNGAGGGGGGGAGFVLANRVVSGANASPSVGLL